MAQHQISDDSLIASDVPTTRVDTDTPEETVVAARNLDVYYGDDQALTDVSIEVPQNRVTAIIGPSGCGKSTFPRCINRRNDRINNCRVDAEHRFPVTTVSDADVDLVALGRLAYRAHVAC